MTGRMTWRSRRARRFRRNTWLPATAGLTPAANLNALTVTALGGATVTLNTGSDAANGRRV